MTLCLVSEVERLQKENDELRKGVIPDNFVFLCIHCAKELKLFGDDDGLEVSTTEPTQLEQPMEMERKDDNMDK